MKAFCLAVVFGLVTTSCPCFSQKKGTKPSLHDQMTGQGYGMSGCGFGSVVFGDKPGLIQVVAVTLNYVGGNQTFGMSSGTSNCGETGKTAQATQFIETNKFAIEKDLSRGQGETIDSLAQVLSCRNFDFSNQMKLNYGKSFPRGNATAGGIETIAYQSCKI